MTGLEHLPVRRDWRSLEQRLLQGTGKQLMEGIQEMVMGCPERLCSLPSLLGFKSRLHKSHDQPDLISELSLL